MSQSVTRVDPVSGLEMQVALDIDTCKAVDLSYPKDVRHGAGIVL